MYDYAKNIDILIQIFEFIKIKKEKIKNNI